MQKSDYEIIKCDDCLRVTYVNNPKLHSHVHSKRIAKRLIEVACGDGTIPLDENYRFYESLFRILPEECSFRCKVAHLMVIKKKKKDTYYNHQVNKKYNS